GIHDLVLFLDPDREVASAHRPPHRQQDHLAQCGKKRTTAGSPGPWAPAPRPGCDRLPGRDCLRAANRSGYAAKFPPRRLAEPAPWRSVAPHAAKAPLRRRAGREPWKLAVPDAVNFHRTAARLRDDGRTQRSAIAHPGPEGGRGREAGPDQGRRVVRRRITG